MTVHTMIRLIRSKKNMSDCELLARWNRVLRWCLMMLLLLGTAMAERAENDDSESPSPVDSTNYLMRYGYLPQSDMETGALRTREELARAVRNFQQMAGLPLTGNLDDNTLDMMAKPRCGVVDVVVKKRTRRKLQHSIRHRHRRYALGPSRWHKTIITYRVLNYSPKLGQRKTREALQRAFRVWSDVARLDFREVSQGHADMMVKFARYYHSDGYPFDGEGRTLAHAFFPGEDRGGDIHFDDDEPWSYKTPTGINFFGVAAHEIGHALGLAHSDTRHSLMYPWYQGYKPNFQLPSDDIIGIQRIYGARDPSRRVPTQSYPTTTVAPTRTSTAKPAADQPPNPCDTSIDAITKLRGQVFIFKREWFWRRNEHGVMPGYPVRIDRFFYGLPKNFQKVDAVYERKEDGRVVMFSGQRYWIFNPNHAISDGPITDFGLPGSLRHIDAIFTWGYNKRTYIISGNMYWRYNATKGKVETYGYPRDMSMWGDVTLPVGAAFTHTDEVTYFFQGDKYWEFNNARMRVRNRMPRSIHSDWLDCNAIKDDSVLPTDPAYYINDDATHTTRLTPFLLLLSLGLSYILWLVMLE